MLHFIWISNCFRTRQTASVQTAIAAATAAAAELATSANPTGMDLDLPVDPNEPTYCFCNQVSYGEMVACDNPDVCFYFFFSYTCLFISILPIFHYLFWCYLLTTVQNRVVSFWLCWIERTTKRKMVLFKLCSNKKSPERQMKAGRVIRSMLNWVYIHHS